MSTDPADDRIVDIVGAATAADPDQLIVLTIRQVLDHDNDAAKLAAALISDEI
jgi:hypothetical protein